MIITYLFNSGFAIQSDMDLLVFDYFKDTAIGERCLKNGVITESLLKNQRNVYVFASHSHMDHFNKVIFDWQKYNPNTYYFLSSDIEKSAKKAGIKNVCLLAPMQSAEVEDIGVYAFGSTDIGVSFMVEYEGKKIFHAGDLNYWHWKDESSESYVLQSKDDFMHELETIQKKTGFFDIAFFPVDSRMGTDFYDGALLFLQKFETGLFIPMHFFQDHHAVEKFVRDSRVKDKKIWQIRYIGQQFNL